MGSGAPELPLAVKSQVGHTAVVQFSRLVHVVLYSVCMCERPNTWALYSVPCQTALGTGWSTSSADNRRHFPFLTNIVLLIVSSTGRFWHAIGTSTLSVMASKVDARLLKSTKFPPEFSQKVDMQKVNLQVMKK